MSNSKLVIWFLSLCVFFVTLLGSFLFDDILIFLAGFGIGPNNVDPDRTLSGENEPVDLRGGSWDIHGARQLPLYSRDSCPLWVNESDAKSEAQTTNLAGIRFMPKGRDFIPWTAVTTTRLLHRLRNKTLLVVGDSVSSQHFVSFACMLLSFEKPIWVKHNVRYHRFLFAADMEFGNGFRLAFSRGRRGGDALGYVIRDIMRGDGLVDFGLFGKETPLFPDIVLGNLGLHFNPTPDMNISLADGLQMGAVETLPLYREAMMITHALEKECDSDITSAARKLPVFIWRETSPQRFDAPGGLYPQKPVPSSVGCRVNSLDEMRTLEWRNRVAYEAFVNVSSPSTHRPFFHLPVWELSASAPYASATDNGKAVDCTHYVLPGIPDTWSHALFDHLLSCGDYARCFEAMSSQHC